MNKFIKFFTLLLFFSVTLFTTGISSQEEIPVPRLQARVTDLTSTLSTAEINELEQSLAAFEKEKGSQVAVLIIPTTGMESIEQYSIKVVENWKLGRKKVDDGVLLLVAKDDRKLRIEVGYGLEGALNDATAKRIISEIITPFFKKGEFYQGISSGVAAILGVIKGEALPEPEATTHGNDIPGYMLPLFLIIYGLAWLFKALFGFLIAAGISAVIVFIASLIATGSLVSGFFSIVLFAVFSLFLTIFILFRGGGGGYSGGYGGSSGGGFSGGGGGSFGGGGSSGNW